MATVTNYIKNMKTIRQFIRNIALGAHSRQTGKKIGASGYQNNILKTLGLNSAQHDDMIRRLKFFNLADKLHANQIGRRKIFTIEKNSIQNGQNYLQSLYNQYAIKGKQVFELLYLIDTLAQYPNSTINDLISYSNELPYFSENYENCCESNSIPVLDIQQVTRQLDKLITLGIVKKTIDSQQRANSYTLTHSIITDLSDHELSELARAIFFYKNIALFSSAGYTLLEKIKGLLSTCDYRTELETPLVESYESQYLFAYNNPLHIIDESILQIIAYAIHEHKKIKITQYDGNKVPVIVTPLAIESDYIGNRDYLICLYKNNKESYRIDQIQDIALLNNTSNINKDILTSKCKLRHRFELRFYKDTNYDLIRNRFLNIFRKFPIEQQTDTIEYEDFTLQTNDGQLIVPILRTFLPYIHIRSTTPTSLFTRFIKDLNDTQKPFQLQEKSKDSTSKYIKGTGEISKETTFVDPLLNELSSIIFLTQYRIQRDLINGHTYSTDDLKFICKNRPLRDPNEPELENDIFELSITKNLIINDNKKLSPMFNHLPKTIITTAEHKFIKDLIIDERVNWMLSPILQTKLIEATQSIENTLPDTLWHNKTITTDESLNTIESLTICHNAIINEESILCEHNDKKIELLPYKLEYNVATNGFNILAYSIESQTFEYYSINTLNSITAIEPSISIDLNSRYLEDFENEQLSATFEIYDIKNAIDRCFTAFTDYEITGNEIESNSNIYTITVRFKTYQQKDFINRLLSLGSAIRVKAPDVLANQINQIFIKAIERHTSQ